MWRKPCSSVDHYDGVVCRPEMDHQLVVESGCRPKEQEEYRELDGRLSHIFNDFEAGEVPLKGYARRVTWAVHKHPTESDEMAND